MHVVRKFDPWKNNLCTCPEKYSLNPYTGCGHGCIYCYATYIPNFYDPRRKKNLVKRLEKDLTNIPSNSIISISNSSDPYTPIDKKYRDMRRCLETLVDNNLRILIVTKGDLILRDIDLLLETSSAVTITITTLKKNLSKKLEPNAPTPQRRLEVLEKLNEEGISTGLRFDPIFPMLTEGEIGDIIKKGSDVGVNLVVSSTFKPRFDSWRKYHATFPEVAEDTKPMYFEEGERFGNSWYLSKIIREKILLQVKKECLKRNLPFATCREGFNMNSSPSCDGSHLCS